MRPRAPRRPRAALLSLLVVLTALVAAGAPVAGAAWQKPVAIRSAPLNTAWFLNNCDQEGCPPSDHALGRLKMTGPRSAVGAVTIPEVWVYDTESGDLVTDGRVPDDENTLQYVVRSRIFGVTLRDGAWTLTDTQAFANDDAPWNGLDFDVGVDAGGNGVLVYREFVKTPGHSEGHVMVRETTPGGWGPPIRLDADSTGVADAGEAPQLSVAANGDVSVYFEDWVCPDRPGSYCQATANWMRQRRGGTWLPAQAVNQDARSPSAMATATGGDGTASFFWNRFGGGAASGALELTGRVVGADGKLGPVVAYPAGHGHPRAVAGPGGRALVLVERGNDGDQRTNLAATPFDGGAFGPLATLSTTRGPVDFVALHGSSDAASLLYVEGGWRVGTGPLDSGFLVFDPLRRRVMSRRWAGGAWSAPVPVDGGLAAPAQQSVTGPDDVAAGGGSVIFAAGAPSPDGLRGADRVYAVDVSGAAPTAPVPIDNGPGGWVHAIAVDRWSDGNGAAMFTQLGPDGNVRLYGVENRVAPAVSRRPVFGREKCVDAYSQLAGCATTVLDPVRAVVAPVKVAADGGLVVRGTAVQVVGRPVGARGAAVSLGARGAAARTRKLASGTVSVAVQQTTARRGCRWWVRSRRRFVAGSCREPVFSVTKVRGGRFALALGKVPAGRVTVWARAARGRKVRQQVLELGTSRRVVAVPRARRGR